MNTAWIIYIALSVIVILMLVKSVRRWMSIGGVVVLAILLFVIFLTPVSVPDTQALAPAWMAAGFELLFGSQELAIRAARPLMFSTLLWLLILLVYTAYRTLFVQSARKQAPAKASD